MKSLSLLVLAGGLCAAGTASAHVSISSGPAAANRSQKITFSIGHGCEGADTIGVRVEIPTGISSVRALTGDFGKPTIEGPSTAVTAVSWRKPLADLQTEDVGYYELSIRARVADVPFTKIDFRVVQTCRTAAGVESTVVWGDATNEAAALVVVPGRQPGWNRYTIATPIVADDLPAYFADAQIVWRGTEAYSANPNTHAMITTTAGVTALAGDVTAGQELWVKY